MREALDACPPGDGRQRGLLVVLNGDLSTAVTMLSAASGLGWSSYHHPAHVLVAVFLALLLGDRRTRLSRQILADLEREPVEVFDDDSEEASAAGVAPAPALATPSVAQLLAVSRCGTQVDGPLAVAMADAVQTIVTRRVDGVLREKRRRHYAGAAALAAVCLEVGAVTARRDEVSRWVTGLRRQYARFPAFQAELKAALAASGG